MDISLLLLLLLPVAAYSGWVGAQRVFAKKPPPSEQKFSPDYLQGLNYLLNEQPDKAVDIFIKLLTVDNDTVETHLTLGAVFRRRGEVNRAIRIHQNLIERQQLSQSQREQAVVELGRDYFRAGLLDRAECLYKELTQSRNFKVYACQQLLKIYQQEQDWQQAIEITLTLEKNSLDDFKPMMAQFYCELAEIQRKLGNTVQTKDLLNQALRMDSNCVRANLILGWLAVSQQQFSVAIEFLHQVERQNPYYLTEIIKPLHLSYVALNQPVAFIDYLNKIVKKHGELVPIQPLVQFIKEQDGNSSALQFVTKRLKQHPSLQAMDYFLNLTLLQPHHQCEDNLNLLQKTTLALLKNQPNYQCESCGFSGKTLHWQCPRCKQWNMVKPLLN